MNDELRKLAEAATPIDENMVQYRYPHGGGRMYREADGSRDLILDCYDEANREFYFQARTAILAILDENQRLREALEECPAIGSLCAEVFCQFEGEELTPRQREVQEWLDKRREALKPKVK